MKKYLALLLAALALTGCGGRTGGACTAERMPEIEYPTLMVCTRDIGVAASQGTKAWFLKDGVGETACSGHPLDDEDAPFLNVFPGDAVTLDFSDPPDEVTAVFWPESTRDDIAHTESQPAEATLTTLTPQPGRNVYELTASWDRETYSGTVRYVFCLDAPGEQTGPASLGSRLKEIAP